MRVLHVTEPCTGGVMEWLRRTTRQQQELEHDVHLLAPHAFPELAGVSRHHWSIDRRRASSVFAAAWELRQLIAMVRPDVVHLHSFIAGVVGRLPLLKDRSLPVVYQPHAWSFNYFPDSRRAAAVRRWERWADSTTTVLGINSLDELEEGRRVGVSSVSAPLGVTVDLKHFVPPTEQMKAQAREELKLDGRRVVIVIGRLCRQKGQDRLVAEWEREPIEDAALYLVGPGDPGPLACLAPNEWNRSIHAVGESSDVRPWFWAADVLAFPSRYEGLSMVMAEALASGLPVVSTSVAGARETITGGWFGPAGALVPSHDMAALLSRVSENLDDPQLRRQQSAQARTRAETFFDPSDFGKRLEAAYTLALTADHANGMFVE
jgi:glycosyltransferase involved in cell wall biosynthesis